MKQAIIGILLTITIIVGVVVLTRDSNNSVAQKAEVANGTQVITVTAKGGYSPRKTSARANMPAILKVKTQGTFDCSSALTIPAIGYNKTLPASGETSIDIPAQKPGTTIEGFCAMGMYYFDISFN